MNATTEPSATGKAIGTLITIIAVAFGFAALFGLV
jgi:hypothetical protein